MHPGRLHALIKRNALNAYNAGGDRNASQAGAIAKCLAFDADYAIGNRISSGFPASNLKPMHAVLRETHYALNTPMHQREEFQQFQHEHARLHGYHGTLVVDAGDGRFLTLTLWETADDLKAARESMEPVVARCLNPLMTVPSRLIGTGPVVVNELSARTP